ncbi:hypothetical protein JT362_01980 [Actinophytocola sp. S1-96]|uniref:DUF3060 domain-containing protein n=1 Tax=Actinophytocola gossypii TaxID=2812003 RepID=A0ABT2J203_9PSEU|nr:hypothetical protein [Actinophytocola gossypii]
MVVGVVAALTLTACGDDPLPAAADGTDLAACSDGSCEVLVDSGDVLDITEFGRVEITIEDDMLEVANRTDDGQGNRSELSAGGAEGRQLQLNNQMFTVVAVKDSQGVLRVGG